MIRRWPRSLAGQMALLIALALFVAQAINFGLVLRDRIEFRLSQATRPVATRIADALDREAHGGRPLVADRGRVRRLAANPIPPSGYERHPEVAAELRRQLADQNLADVHPRAAPARPVVALPEHLERARARKRDALQPNGNAPRADDHLRRAARRRLI